MKTLATFALIFAATVVSYSQDDGLSVLDIKEYSAAKESSEDLARRIRYNGQGLMPGAKVVELQKDWDSLSTINHWWRGVPALPFAVSDAVVVGTVKERHAFMSQDESGVFTAFETDIEEIFIDKSGSLQTETRVPLIRMGGKVKFPSGKVQTYSIHNLDPPKKNAKYVFFLRRVNGLDWSIVTGYQMVDGKISPLDGWNEPSKKNILQFGVHADRPVAEFLADVKAGIK